MKTHRDLFLTTSAFALATAGFAIFRARDNARLSAAAETTARRVTQLENQLRLARKNVAAVEQAVAATTSASIDSHLSPALPPAKTAVTSTDLEPDSAGDLSDPVVRAEHLKEFRAKLEN